MSERETIIRDAHKLEVSTQTLLEDSRSSRYERSEDRILTAALDRVWGHGLADDEIRTFDGHTAQIGCYLLHATDQGFLTHETFDSADAASIRVGELAEDFDRGGEQ